MKIVNILLLTILLTIVSLAGCGNTSEENQPTQVAYYCRETKQIVFTTKQDVPAINPSTGKKTLFPAMYCEQCKQWHPAPNIEQLQRTTGVGNCPKCKVPMTAKGPLPEETN